MLKTEIEKIRKMSASEAIDYIWTYYRNIILGAALALFVVISLATTIAVNKRRDPVIRVAVQSDLDLLCGNELDQILSGLFPEGTGDRAPEKMSFSSAGSQNDPYAVIQITSWIAAGELDCILCDRPTRDFFSQDPSEFQIDEISDSVPGRIVANAGIGELYFVTVKTSDKAAQTALLLEKLKEP